GVDRGAGGEIVRLPLDGGDIETVAVTPGPVPALESVEGKIIVATADGSGGVDFYELSGSELVRFGGASPLSDPLHGTGTVNVVGASESGVYVRRSQPGGDQPLLLVRFDGAPHGPVISTREPLLTLAVWAGRLIVITPGHILSLAPWGGETETLLDQGNATSLVHSIAVDEHSICWASGSDKNDGAPRCMPQGGGEVRAFGNARATALELTDGVLVWTVTSAEGTKVLAAIP
ncbi:MAG: hypothetical protein HOV80_35440, partial [Polyangiaceae bacterium]|nr:hypothetical protein [Polyangiaceae bacterium]